MTSNASREGLNEETFHPPGPDEALEWIAALCAAGLNYRLTRAAGGGWELHVPAAQSAAAWAQLCAIENERLVPSPSAELPPPVVGLMQAGDASAVWTAFWSAYALALFYLWTGPYDGGLPVFQAGCAHAGKIMEGQWWRSITALTLHSGLPHLLANAVFIFAVGQAVAHAFGRGAGLLLMLGGGVVGNLLAAWVSDPEQISVGASTMCFAALGIMSTRQTVAAFRRWRRPRVVWKRVWLPMAAGLALLGMMGTGEQSDLAGHAFGFLAGAVLALPLCAAAAPPRLSPAMQWLLTALAALIPPLGWSFALLR